MSTRSTYKYKVEIDQSSLNKYAMDANTALANSMLQSSLMTQSVTGLTSEANLSGMMERFIPDLPGFSPKMKHKSDPFENFNYAKMYSADVAKGVADWWGGEIVGGAIGGFLTGGPVGALVGAVAGDFLLGDTVSKATDWGVDKLTGGSMGKSRLSAAARVGSLGDHLSARSAYKLSEKAFEAVGGGNYGTVSEGFGYDDLADVGIYGMQSGELTGDQSIAEFTSNYKNLLSKTKQVMKVLGQSHSEVIKGMKELQQQGIFNVDDAAMEMVNQRSKAALSPYSVGELNQIRRRGYMDGANTSYGGLMSGRGAEDYAVFGSGLNRDAIFGITQRTGKEGAANFGRMVGGAISRWTDSAAGQHNLLSMMTVDAEGELAFDAAFAQRVKSGDVDELTMLGRAETVLQAKGDMSLSDKNQMLKDIAQEFKPEEISKMMGDDIIRDLQSRKMEVTQGNFMDSLLHQGYDANTAKAVMVAYQNPEAIAAQRYAEGTLPWARERMKKEAYDASITGMIYNSDKAKDLKRASNFLGGVYDSIGDTLQVIPDYWSDAGQGAYGDSRKGIFMNDVSSIGVAAKSTDIKYSDEYSMTDEMLSRGGDVKVGGRTIRHGLAGTQYATNKNFERLGLKDSIDKRYDKNIMAKGGIGIIGGIKEFGQDVKGMWNMVTGDREEMLAVKERKRSGRYADRQKKYHKWFNDTTSERKSLLENRRWFFEDPGMIEEIAKEMGSGSEDKDIQEFVKNTIDEMRQASVSEEAWGDEAEMNRSTAASVQLEGLSEELNAIAAKPHDPNMMTKASYDVVKSAMNDKKINGLEYIEVAENLKRDGILKKSSAQGQSVLTKIGTIDGGPPEGGNLSDKLKTSKMHEYLRLNDQQLTINGLQKLGQIVDMMIASPDFKPK